MFRKFTIPVIICFLVIAGYFIAPRNYQETIAVSPTTYPTTTICYINESALVTEINKVREIPVSVNQDLVDFALHRVAEIPSDWSHAGFRSHIPEVSIPFIRLGENLAKGYCDEKSLVNAWIDSPSHYKILIDTRYDYIGLGISKTPVGIYVVAIFGESVKVL